MNKYKPLDTFLLCCSVNMISIKVWKIEKVLLCDFVQKLQIHTPLWGEGFLLEYCPNYSEILCHLLPGKIAIYKLCNYSDCLQHDSGDAM